MTPLLLTFLLAAPPALEPGPDPTLRVLAELKSAQGQLRRGAAGRWSRWWRTHLDAEALSALVLVDHPELSPQDRRAYAAALRDLLERRAQTWWTAEPELRKTTCTFSAGPRQALGPQIIGLCQGEGRRLNLELWVDARGRIYDGAVDGVQLSRNLRGQLNRSLRQRGVAATLERLKAWPQAPGPTS